MIKLRNILGCCAVILLFFLTHSCKKDSDNPIKDVDTLIKDYDGNVYTSVKIGDQVWLAKDLKTTHYNNGDKIPGTNFGDDNLNFTYPKFHWVVNDMEDFYTWYAITDPRGVCPVGWHIPTDSEWKTLTTYLGGESVAGGKLMYTSNGGTSESGFNASFGHIFNFCTDEYGHPCGNWWSSTNRQREGWALELHKSSNSASTVAIGKEKGAKVRCIKGEGVAEDDDWLFYYKIYIDKQNHITKVICPGTHAEYQYTDTTVIKSSGNITTTYFINDLGLADSCLVKWRISLSFYQPSWQWYQKMYYFKYYADGHLKYNGFQDRWYKWADGNMTECYHESNPSSRYEVYYNYTSLLNDTYISLPHVIFDGYEFEGSYLGMVSRNLVLVESKKYTISTSYVKVSTLEHSYTFDSNNYVIRDTCKSVDISGNREISIIRYEYIFLDN